jgi:hypothetical protein
MGFLLGTGSPILAVGGRLTYILLYLVFKRVYKGDGVSADCVQKKKGLATRLLIQLGAGIYNHYFRQKRVGIHVLGRDALMWRQR